MEALFLGGAGSKCRGMDAGFVVASSRLLAWFIPPRACDRNLGGKLVPCGPLAHATSTRSAPSHPHPGGLRSGSSLGDQ